jgi:uncharacterized DUF497 family protein
MKFEDIQFEWEDEKEQKIIKAHGLDFETAKYIFADQERIERYDEKHSIDEDRWQTMGMINNVVFLVYTERRGKIHIITARVADPEERRIYGNSNFNLEGWRKANT